MAKYLVSYTVKGDIVVEANSEIEAYGKFDEVDWDTKMELIYVGSDKIEDIKETERRY